VLSVAPPFDDAQGAPSASRGAWFVTENVPFDITEALARAGPRLGPFGNHLSWHEQVGSTNDVAAAAAEAGAPEGLVVVANTQSLGRGRVGRSWSSPPGAGLYVSVVLRPGGSALQLLTIAAGVAIAEGVDAASGLQTCLKWPNDVSVGSRKLAGILAEGSSPGAVDHVVLGFGINIRRAAYPPDVVARATSLESELGRDVDRGLVLAECLAALSFRYGMLQTGVADDVIAAWRKCGALFMGRAVEWDDDGGSRRGRVEDIDATGALLVRVDDRIVRVISGEVRWLA
jgi:BirA family transcriptional regulator, biotin operon repressor / biotin---[acetyl-CoA-carboxylase] ligase